MSMSINPKPSIVPPAKGAVQLVAHAAAVSVWQGFRDKVVSGELGAHGHAVGLEQLMRQVRSGSLATHLPCPRHDRQT